MRKPRSDYPSEQADKFLVRFPAGMRARIAEAAKANGRSMNAEIVQRLDASFERGGDSEPDEQFNIAMHADTLNEMLQAAKNVTPKLLHPADENTVYILLDTDGMPISWHEVHTHLSALNKAAGMALHSQQTFVLTPEMISSYEREDEDIKLVTEYAKLQRSARKARDAKDRS